MSVNHPDGCPHWGPPIKPFRVRGIHVDAAVTHRLPKVVMPISAVEGVTLVKKIYLKFKKAGIDVIRMGLQASEDLEDGTTVLAGPHHPAFGHMVHSEIFLDKAIAAIASAGSIKETLTIFVNPRSISKMRGLNNSNIKSLQSRFQLTSLAVKTDVSIPEENLMIQ